MKTEFIDTDIPSQTGSEWDPLVKQAMALKGSKVMKITFDDHPDPSRNHDEARRMVGCVHRVLRYRKVAIEVRQRGCVVYFRKVSA